ncbi:hypothetical protein ACWOAN_03975 [Lactococcus taiwanensis]|uniref:hypothetical protein n=1 Tax=Lactococcus taiwanensis TaxID=1151742 RepID=UPI0019043351|nr:hypothetical protein [Lactococcus taiwanensis]
MLQEIQTLSFLEIDILRAYKSVKGVEEGNFYSAFGNEKELYECSSDYKHIVDEWEKLQKEMSPKILNLYREVLALRAEWILKDKTDLE